MVSLRNDNKLSEKDIITYNRKGLPDHRYYVLVWHSVSGKCFLMSRNYSLISNGTETDHIFAQEKCIQIWNGWKPSAQSQLPDWAVGLPASEFIAYWMWNK